MANHTYTLTEEYIELNALLKVLGLASTGGHAKVMIAEGLVEVDGEVESRIRRKLRPGQVVRVGDEVVNVVS
jgi:ribosome-associated protein